MKKFILLTILVGMLLTSCSANSNAEEQTIPTETSEARSVETVPESTAEESKITTVTTVSETTEISETTETSQATETQKPPQDYDVESVPYKAASIVYNEYLEFQNGQFEEWWVNDKDNDSPHVCTKVLIFDMNGDGRKELISMKNALSPYDQCYYTIYDFDSGEMLFNGYYGESDGKLYCKDGQYCLKFRGIYTMAYVVIAAEELENELPNAFEALGYNEDYFYIGNKVNATIYKYKNTTVYPTPYEGTEDSQCLSFSTTEGLICYHGDMQLNQLERDFESNFDDCEEIGELWFIGEPFDNNVQVDGIFGIHLLQRHVNDFDALVERLSLYEE